MGGACGDFSFGGRRGLADGTGGPGPSGCGTVRICWSRSGPGTGPGRGRPMPSPGDDEPEFLSAAEQRGRVPEWYGDLDYLAGGKRVDAGECGDGYVGGGLFGVELA